jgi:hypothetical protein
MRTFLRTVDWLRLFSKFGHAFTRTRRLPRDLHQQLVVALRRLAGYIAITTRIRRRPPTVHLVRIGASWYIWTLRSSAA